MGSILSCCVNLVRMFKNFCNRFCKIVDAKETLDDYIDPYLVYSNSELGEIHDGVNFMITGRILPNCERFSINFIVNTANRDIAFHVNPRLPQNYIVRNCRVKGIWGTEEVTSVLPFSLERGKQFSIQILVTEVEFLIAINGRHFATFCHRLPFSQINQLEVKGDVEDIAVEHGVATAYPKVLIETEPKHIHIMKELSASLNCFESALSTGWGSKIACGVNEKSIDVPFYGKLLDSFLNGKCLRIEGRVKVLPHSFFINLQAGHHIWPHPIIAFHFNPRFANVGGKHIICRNSWFDNKWDKEERTEMKTDFMPGKSFTLYIYCGENGYEVYLNKNFLTEYKFRVKPELVDTVYLQGDVKLWEVILEEGKGSDLK